jgi:hypothetical protein
MRQNRKYSARAHVVCSSSRSGQPPWERADSGHAPSEEEFLRLDNGGGRGTGFQHSPHRLRQLSPPHSSYPYGRLRSWGLHGINNQPGRGSGGAFFKCLLMGAKETWRGHGWRSANDPKPTSATAARRQVSGRLVYLPEQRPKFLLNLDVQGPDQRAVFLAFAFDLRGECLRL